MTSQLDSLRMLVVDDEADERTELGSMLERFGHQVGLAGSGKEALGILRKSHYDLLLVDLRMPGMDGIGFIKKAVLASPLSLPIVVTAFGDVPHAVKAVQSGARDFLEKPLKSGDLKKVLSRYGDEIRLRRSMAGIKEHAESSMGFDLLLGQSPAMLAVYREIVIASQSEANVLITGETGTGKELVCDSIHARSKRKDGALVKLNCAALPDTLADSELFGHVRGAFTGAIRNQPGKLRAAHGGTLFLDEVNALSLAVQAKLLRAVQYGSFYPVGDSNLHHADVRLIAASNENIEKLVANGQFRRDLYYRLNVLSIALPPLRERPEDIPLIAYRFLASRQKPLDITPEALRRLLEHRWEGNVRHLENVLERAASRCVASRISVSDLPRPFQEGSHDGASISVVLDRIERLAIERALHHSGGRVKRVSEALHVPLRTLQRKMQRYGFSWRDIRMGRQ